VTGNTQKDTVYLSLIIPAYNEERRIAKSLKQILQYLETQPYASEVVIVNDGSMDRTVEVVRGICQGRDRVHVLQNGKYLGKGGAVRSGMLQAREEFLFFTDADLSGPIETIGLFLTNLVFRLRSSVNNSTGFILIPRQLFLVEKPQGKIIFWKGSRQESFLLLKRLPLTSRAEDVHAGTTYNRFLTGPILLVYYSCLVPGFSSLMKVWTSRGTAPQLKHLGESGLVPSGYLMNFK